VSIFQLPTAKLLEMPIHYANISMEMLSLFIDSSINNDQTRLYQLLLEFINIHERHLVETLLHDCHIL